MAQGFDPLLAVNVVLFDFRFNGVRYSLANYLDDTDAHGSDIKIYQDLLSGLNHALASLAADNPGIAFESLNLSLGDDFSIPYESFIGTDIVLTASGNNDLEVHEFWVEIMPAAEPLEIDGVTAYNSSRFEIAVEL